MVYTFGATVRYADKWTTVRCVVVSVISQQSAALLHELLYCTVRRSMGVEML